MTLGEKTTALRSERKLSQERLAEELGVSRQSISKWENDQSIPDLEKLIRLADLFGLSVDELVRDESAPPSPAPQPQQILPPQHHGLTTIQKSGVCFTVIGGIMTLLGVAGDGGLLALFGIVLLLSSLPLMLAKHHPLLILSWLWVAGSWAIFNPYTSVTPLGLLGGVQRLYYYCTIPAARAPSTLLGICIAIGRGLLTLILVYLTYRAWKQSQHAKNPHEAAS